MKIICGEIEEVIFVILREKEEIFKKKLKEIKEEYLRKKIESEDIKYIIGFLNGVGVRESLIIYEEKEGN